MTKKRACFPGNARFCSMGLAIVFRKTADRTAELLHQSQSCLCEEPCRHLSPEKRKIQGSGGHNRKNLHWSWKAPQEAVSDPGSDSRPGQRVPAYCREEDGLVKGLSQKCSPLIFQCVQRFLPCAFEYDHRFPAQRPAGCL